jgi:hypothetical protein
MVFVESHVSKPFKCGSMIEWLIHQTSYHRITGFMEFEPCQGQAIVSISLDILCPEDTKQV